ncbi:hypothetical protein EIP91_002065 [Steccherinum ochraceum]|uniref:DUF6533 domain-containing protein n=1 Tax=Steccherinum ochraceum TaxID=92696 RepID=A0A4R0RPC3_9APHY|nr:hypothetical protein EIP91_002065 [Steccherinum ochraceum]
MSPPQDVADLVRTHRLIFSSSAAGTMLLLFDTLISLDDEVELVWRSSNTPPKFLYFISRYLGLFVQIIYLTDVFPLYCPTQLYFRSVVELSLMIRIYALWGQQRNVATFLVLTWLCEQIANFTLLARAIWEMAQHTTPIPSDWLVTGCLVESVPYFFNLCWLPVLLYETLLFFMSAYKCLSFRPSDNTPLLVRLFRDGTVIYLWMCCILVISIFSQFHPEFINSAIVDTWMTSVFSMAGSHLMLSIRRLAADSKRKQLATPNISVAIPEFASPQEAALYNFGSLSSRTCDLPPGADYEMQPLANRSSGNRPTPYRRNPQINSSNEGPPKLSLNLPYIREPLTELERVSTAEETAVAAVYSEPDSHRWRYFFARCPMTLNRDWLDDWGTKT